MHYAEDVERARLLAEKALALMAEEKVPATPTNFEIWYSYAAGRNDELKRSVDGIRAAKQPFTSEVLEQLSTRFFTANQYSAEVMEVGGRMEERIADLLSSLETAGKQTSDYGRTLDGVSGKLAEHGDGSTSEPAALKAVIDNLVVATRQMQARSQSLESKLQQSTQEVQELRTHLEEIRNEAMTDPLTGIANRKAFDEALQHGASESMETGEPMALLLLDIDHFKNFNDTWGHQTGDLVLRVVAGCLEQNLKGRDTAARYGGEEFAVILPRTNLAAGVTVAEQIRQTIHTKRLVKRNSGEVLGTLTLSAGVAQYTPGEPLENLIQRADAALYAAKRGGRNRVMSQNHPDVSTVTMSQRGSGERKAG